MKTIGVRDSAQAWLATITAELEATRPLSVVMGEKITELREWAAERTVPAD